MAGNLINTLYPPIADTFMPAFVNDEDAYILFSLSPYNSQRDVKRIHVTLTDQKTNHKVLDNRNDTENKIFIDDGIMILDINDAAYDSESGLYKITISPLLLKQEFRPSGGEDTSPENYFKIET